MIVTVQCFMCHDYKDVDVPQKGFLAWRDGELIQNAMPTVSREDRELLISKTCNQCFSKLFSGFSEEDHADA